MLYLNNGLPGTQFSVTPQDFGLIIKNAIRTKRWPESLNISIQKLTSICDNTVSSGYIYFQLAKILVESYKIFNELIEEQKGDTQLKIVKIDKIVGPDIYKNDLVYMRPVLGLASYCEKYLQSWTKAVLLHGSLATLDYLKDYSDLDTVMIISIETLSDSSKLKSFRRIYRKSLGYLYWFDPLQHHGHIVYTEFDLEWYPERFLPIAVFENSRSLTGKHVIINFFVRDSTDECIDEFRRVARVFKDRAKGPWIPKDPWNVKNFLSEFMLLPAIYCQALGFQCYKKNSFDIAKRTLPPDIWEVMNKATIIRENWRYNRVDCLLNRIFVLLGLPPRIVRKISTIRHKRIFYSGIIEKSFVQDAANLADYMLKHVENNVISKLDDHVLLRQKNLHNVSPNLKLMHLPFYRTIQEYQAALDRYLEQISRINSVKAVYQFGSIKAPGLSDIDLAVIVDEKISPEEISKLSISNLSVDDQEIFLHDPLVFTKQTSNILFEFLYVNNLIQIYGENCKLEIEDKLPSMYKRWALSLEIMPQYIYFIHSALAQCTVDVRWAIPVLRSIKYSIELNPDLKTRFFEDWKNYSNDINFLCDNWFSFSDDDSAILLESVLLNAWKIVTDMAWALDDELLTANKFSIERQMNLNIERKMKPITLTYSLNKQAIAKKEKPKNFDIVQDDKLFYPLPQSCILMLDVYKTKGGLLTRFIDKLYSNWSGIAASTEFELYLIDRSCLLNKQIEFLNGKKIGFGCVASSFIWTPDPPENKFMITKYKPRKLIRFLYSLINKIIQKNI
jgi:predicted nucleotidyltransferase